MTQGRAFADEVQQLADQVAQLGVGALGALFDRTSQRLVRFATSVTRHQHDAEDAVQAVLARVAARPDRLAAAECPWAYLLKMVRNESLVTLRRRRRTGLLDGLSDLLTRCRVDELEMEETYRSVWRALRRLPTEQAEVIVLKIWEAMTFSQIATVLDISPNTAASRYQYGIKKLSGTLRGLQSEVERA